jgi:hypothetical protein
MSGRRRSLGQVVQHPRHPGSRPRGERPRWPRRASRQREVLDHRPRAHQDRDLAHLSMDLGTDDGGALDGSREDTATPEQDRQPIVGRRVVVGQVRHERLRMIKELEHAILTPQQVGVDGRAEGDVLGRQAAIASGSELDSACARGWIVAVTGVSQCIRLAQ